MQTPRSRLQPWLTVAALCHSDLVPHWSEAQIKETTKNKTKYWFIGFVCLTSDMLRESSERDLRQIFKRKPREFKAWRAKKMRRFLRHCIDKCAISNSSIYFRASVRSHQSSFQVISLSHPFLSPFPRHMPRVTCSWSNPGWWIPLATFATDLLSSIITTNKKMRDFAC